MRYDFLELSVEEVRDHLPEMEDTKKILAYAIIGDGDDRLAVAVFIPAVLNPKEAVLFHFTTAEEVEGNEVLMDRFFDRCFKRLQTEGFESIYYRSTGSIEQLVRRYDLVTRAGFEAKVYIGEIQSYPLGYLLANRPSGSKAEKLAVMRMDAVDSRQTRAFLNNFALDNPILQKAVYSSDYSFFHHGEDDIGGVMCMAHANDLLMMTAIDIRANDKRTHKMILKALLDALIQACIDTELPEETQVQFLYSSRLDRFVSEKFFGSQGTITNYQEFFRNL